jgi:multidrug efflux pump subunit AcrA (membrane-fusion protein)
VGDSDANGKTWVRSRWLAGVAAGLVLVLFVAGGVVLVTRWGGNDSSELVLYGNVDVREVDLAFNEGDRIVAMHVEEGDQVEAGQLLAELDASRLEHLVLEAEANVAAQRAVVARLEHGSRPDAEGTAGGDCRRRGVSSQGRSTRPRAT